MIAFRIEDPVFTREIWFYVGDRKDAYRLLAERYGEKKAKQTITKDAHGMTFTMEAPNPKNQKITTKVYYIWLSEFTGSSVDIATVSHECFHCACMIADTLDIPTDEAEGSEVIAHYMGFLITEILKKLGLP